MMVMNKNNKWNLVVIYFEDEEKLLYHPELYEKSFFHIGFFFVFFLFLANYVSLILNRHTI